MIHMSLQCDLWINISQARKRIQLMISKFQHTRTLPFQRACKTHQGSTGFFGGSDGKVIKEEKLRDFKKQRFSSQKLFSVLCPYFQALLTNTHKYPLRLCCYFWLQLVSRNQWHLHNRHLCFSFVYTVLLPLSLIHLEHLIMCKLCVCMHGRVCIDSNKTIIYS